MSHLVAVLVVAAAAFPIDAGMTAAKIALVGMATLIVLARPVEAARLHRPVTLMLAYCAFLATFAMHADYWVARIFFNLIAVTAAAAALRLIPLTPVHFAVMALAALAFLAVKLSFELGTAKLQVHQQCVALYAVLIAARGHLPGARFAHPAVLIASLAVEVRSVAFAAAARAVIGPRLPTFAVAAAVALIFLFIYTQGRSVAAHDHVGSLYWRLQHWDTVLTDFFELSPWTGAGLGGVWRDFTHLLELEWYRQGSYVDSHNIFVQVVYDTGLIGLAAYIALLTRLHSLSGRAGRELIVMFAIVGLFQGGPWDFQLALVFAVAWLTPVERAAVIDARRPGPVRAMPRPPSRDAVLKGSAG